jgi:peptidoglycan/xylan/chitin deacetylase (PgdA/CDA1 family)
VFLPGSWFVPFRLASLLVLLIAFVTVFFADGWRHDASLAQREEPRLARMPVSTAPAGTPVQRLRATPLPAATPTPVVTLNPADLLEHAPNELGVVPILEYHMITTNPAEEAQFVRTADDMRADLQWLYEHNFHVVPLQDVVSNSIAVPAGKHPVALTFDDGTSTQFSFIENARGELVPDPDSAVGILEEFFTAHPDFGRGGHFGLLVFNGFANPDTSQEPYLEQKVQWMIEHGYEVGNHTWQHTDLTDITTDEFVMTVAEPMIWADEMMGDVPGNQSRILTLPFGTTPDANLHPDQRQMMREGFTYNGQSFQLAAALLVGAEPSVSPASNLWDPMWIPRIQMFDESVEFWFGEFENGGMVLYTSDGHADTVVVPYQLPAALEAQLDPAALIETGKMVIQYDPETGQTEIAGGRARPMATHMHNPWWSRRS